MTFIGCCCAFKLNVISCWFSSSIDPLPWKHPCPISFLFSFALSDELKTNQSLKLRLRRYFLWYDKPHRFKRLIHLGVPGKGRLLKWMLNGDQDLAGNYQKQWSIVISWKWGRLKISMTNCYDEGNNILRCFVSF